MTIATKQFEPKNSNEYRCLEIARALGESDMRFILNRLSRYGIGVIEEAWGVIKETPDGQIRDRRRYFNKLIDTFGNPKP